MNEGLNPIEDATARILILGTMPGAQSLCEGHYYAHPRNRFWDVVAELRIAGRDLLYEERVARLKAKGVALWDVLESCERHGSLDRDIRHGVLNKLHDFLDRHSGVRAIFLNGKKALTLWNRRVWNTDMLSDTQKRRITCHGLPSTSPAYPHSKQQVVDAWVDALHPYLEVV